MTPILPELERELLIAHERLQTRHGRVLERAARVALFAPLSVRVTRELAASRSSSAEASLGAVAYRLRTSRGGKLWAAIGASGTALTAGIITAIVLLSSGAPAAYAGWTPVPATPRPAAVATATAACNDANGSPVLTGRPVVTDARGIYTAAIYTFGDDTWICISDGQRDDSELSMNRLVLASYAAPGPDQIGLPTGGGGSAQGFDEPSTAQSNATLQNLPGPVARREAILRRGLETHLAGRAGKDVSAVKFLFVNATTVDATVQNGWYFAWWPGLDNPTSVQVTTSSGTVTSQMPGQQCRTGSSSCVFAGVGQALPGSTTNARAPTATTR
ncbi:MAG: hypothetical protein ACP5H2_10955 [Solirubrobacteraceae bacterium]